MRRAAATIFLMAMPGLAVAQEAPPSAAPLILGPIDVIGQEERGDGPVQGYRATRSTTATRTDTPLIETPASVTVLPRDLSRDRNSRSAAEALIAVRGLLIDESNAFQIDGMRTRNLLTFDPALFERVEVLKGPTSLLYGSMEPGGVVNFVTARPTREPFAEGGVQAASYNDVRTTLDAGYSLDGGSGVRLPVVARRYDSFRDEVDDNRSPLRTSSDQDTVSNFFGVGADGRTLDPFRVEGDTNVNTQQFHSKLVAGATLLGMSYTALVGVDLLRDRNATSNDGDQLVPIDILASANDGTVAVPDLVLDTYRQEILTQSVGAYFQDQITVLGARYDAYEQSTDRGGLLFGAPRHRASLWISYRVEAGALEGVGGGVGIFYTGEGFADNANDVRLSSYRTVDAALWYRPSEQTAGSSTSLEVDVKNLQDEGCFLGGNGFNSIEPGEPRTLYAGLRMAF